jgi:glucose-6-phosphate isomerase
MVWKYLRGRFSLLVMAGLVPAIHVLSIGKKDVDARHKAGHDG